MIKLKGGYYIDELNRILEKLTDQKTVTKFQKRAIGFELSNCQEFIRFDEVNPLLKVAWNIITRGTNTRATIRVSDYLLHKYLKEAYKGYSTSTPEIKFNIVHQLENEGNTLDFLLANFVHLTEEDVVEYGTRILNLFKLLKSLHITAQLQRSIVLLLMQNEENTTFSFHGIDIELGQLIIDDLNDLFTSLNDLTEKDEVKLPLLNIQPDGNITTISVNKKVDSAVWLRQMYEVSEDAFNNVLTDRNISYRKLGKVVEEEKDGKYLQHFEYKTQKQQKALLYFLNNIFRKSKFRAGQEAIINRAIIGLDVIGLLPTGGGKSLTFQICSLLQPGVTIVVDPINSLMKDQYDKLIENGISKTIFINSFNTKDEREANTEMLTNGQVHIIFVSPERFQIERFRIALHGCRGQNVFFSYAVIDEAHCVSEWGHDFRQVYLNLAQNIKRFCAAKNREISVFGLTATASFDVLADVQRELDLNEDAIVSLPAEAIDRKELNFNIIPVDCDINSDLDYWDREKKIGLSKYPQLKYFLKNLPQKINSLEKSYGNLNTSHHFFDDENGVFKNAGVIFCPTKSNKLPNGVLHLTNGREINRNNTTKPPTITYDGSGLKELSFLNITTFFGGGSDDMIRDDYIESEAEQSVKNQESFLRNEANLMVATKAFGMGIDKPNIRYSIHYSFPSSVESFYQEAGRAGRDGMPSICSILYHPEDIQTNYDFYQNSFKGIQRERDIINELLDEVQYEDGFFVNVISRIVKDKYPKVSKISLWNNRYLNIFGAYKEQVRIGKIDLNYDDLRNYDNWRQNIEQDEANEILDYIRETIKKECESDSILDWLQTKSTDGIKTLIESGSNEKYTLKVGFTNGVISRMNDAIKESGYEDFEEVVIRAAYNFSADEDDFLDNLRYQYYRYQVKEYGHEVNQFHANDYVRNFLKENYSRIRNSMDTQRAIYRMNIVGIIDDYVIDYVAGMIEVRFKAKSDKEYRDNFNQYLRRYLGLETTRKWLAKVYKVREDSILKQVLYVLIQFIESEISDKRKRSIDYMQQLCGVFLTEGEQEFRDRMIRYFTSKYARTDYLPADTENGRKENCQIVKKYIDYIDNPPDGLGGQIDNAKHLRGACDNLRINMVENASVDLLTAFSLFALELKEDDTIENAQDKPLVKNAINLYRTGFRRMLRIDTWDDVLELITIFNDKVLDFNAEIKPLMDLLSAELLVNRTSFKLKQLLDKIE